MVDKLFWDTNVMLDLLGERYPHYDAAAKIATLAFERDVSIIVSSLSFTTVNYIISRYETPKAAIEKLRKFTLISSIASVDGETIEQALQGNFPDFEDEVQYLCAAQSNCDFILTRNAKDFKKAILPVMSPLEYLASINQS